MIERRYCTLPAMFLLAGLVALPADSVRAEIADEFYCASCHTNRLREFRRQTTALVAHEPNPALPTGRQPEVSSPDMCFSCHDGFVDDSRDLWAEGHLGHPVGVKPAAEVAARIAGDDPVLALNESGAVYCGSCHSAHEDYELEGGTPTFMRVAEDGNLCQVCHADKSTIAGSPHALRPRRGRPVPADFASRGACSRCHAPHEARGPALWARQPAEAGSTIGRLCMTCHDGDVDASGHPGNVLAWDASLRGAFSPDKGPPMPVYDSAGSSTPGLGKIECATCHDAHRQRAEGLPEARNGKFLRRVNTEHFLCADCHGGSSLHRYAYFHRDAAWQ